MRGDFVAGIDDDGLAGGFVAQDGAVALERADGKNLANHGHLRPRRAGRRLILWRGVLGWCSGEDGAVDVRAAEHHGERDGDDDEDHRAPCGELGGRLAAPRGPKAVCDPWPPKARRDRRICPAGAANSDQKQADDDVNDYQKMSMGIFSSPWRSKV